MNGAISTPKTTAAPRKGDWIQTYSGRPFWPLDPRPEEVFVTDIAHMLAMKCRYSGATRAFYSVAQHAVLLSHAVPYDLAFAALHHDDAEAYLPDVPSPVKPLLVGFKAVETEVERVIGVALGLMTWEFRAVKPWDRRILADECTALLNPPQIPWSQMPEPLGITIEPWEPKRAEAEFLARHEELRGLSLAWR